MPKSDWETIESTSDIVMGQGRETWLHLRSFSYVYPTYLNYIQLFNFSRFVCLFVYLCIF